MADALQHYLSSVAQLSPEAAAEIAAKGVPMSLGKRHYLLREGEPCRHVAFVKQGLLRQFLMDENGQHHTTQFAKEHGWISDRESFATGIPSSYYIQAIENSELTLFGRKELEGLQAEFPEFQRFLMALKERNAFVGERRVVSALSYSAQQKYEAFRREHGDLLLRAPAHAIASFLGIAPETLSRLRKK